MGLGIMRSYARRRVSRHDCPVMGGKIIECAENNDLAGLKKAILSHEDVNQQKDGPGITALHAAVARGNTESVATLLAVPDIKLDIEDKFGRTPVVLAISLPYDDIVELLREHIADNLDGDGWSTGVRPSSFDLD